MVQEKTKRTEIPVRLLVIMITALLIASNSLWSQTLGPMVSIEVNTPLIELIPVDGGGFLMFEYQAMRLNDQEAGLVISKYNRGLTKVWDSVLPFEKNMQPVYYRVIEGDLFILLCEPRHQQYRVFRINTESAKGIQMDYSFSNPFYARDLVADGSRIWVSGIMAQHGVLFELSPAATTYSTLPTAYAQPVTDVLGIDYDPELKVLSYLLKTIIDKKESYILRGIEVTQTRVVFDIPLSAKDKYHLGQIKAIQDQQRQFITGTFYKKDPRQTEGIFQYIIENGTIVSGEFRSFDDMPGFNDYLEVNLDKGLEKGTGKSRVQAQLDEVFIRDGEIIASLELLEEQYHAKGAVQQEFEQSFLVNYLDQDQSGRRSYDQAASYTGANQAAEDRIYQGSATDILNYRYRNAILGQPMFQGFGFERNVVIQFHPRMIDLSCSSIKIYPTQVSFMQVSNTFEDQGKIRHLYDAGGKYHAWIYDPGNREISTFEEQEYLEGKGKLFRLEGNGYLGANITKDGDKMVLKLQQITL